MLLGMLLALVGTALEVLLGLPVDDEGPCVEGEVGGLDDAEPEEEILGVEVGGLELGIDEELLG